MKRSLQSSTSSSVDEIVAADGIQRQVLLAKAQLEVGKVVKLSGESRGRADYLVGLVTLVATSTHTEVKYRVKESRENSFYAQIWCATSGQCSVSSCWVSHYSYWLWQPWNESSVSCEGKTHTQNRERRVWDHIFCIGALPLMRRRRQEDQTPYFYCHCTSGVAHWALPRRSASSSKKT